MADVLKSAFVKTWRLYANCRFGQIHIAAAGPISGSLKNVPSNKPPLVCFHTTPLSGKEFKEFQQSMAQDRVVLCLDTPGYGGSDAPPKPPTLADYVEAMADALGDLGYGTGRLGMVDVLGCRTGSLIALELACAHSDLVRAAILTCVPLVDSKQRQYIKTNYGTEEPLYSSVNYLSNSFQTYVLDGPIEVDIERRYDLFTERMRAGTRAWWAADAVVSYDTEAGLKKLSQPALFLVLRCLFAENTRQASRIAPNASLLDVEAQNPQVAKGHTGAEPWTLQPDFLADCIRGHLDKVRTGTT